VAEAAGITDKTPTAERATALKGKTIAIQGVGSIIHAWERYVANIGGLDVENDVRIAPMDPPAMLPALENKAIDVYATSMPFTTQAVVRGSAIMLISAVLDAPELLPFAYGLIYTRPETCQTKRDTDHGRRRCRWPRCLIRY
jgi:ABC-type nitrate/sulfonate/bicarbonate transport system substrate-binding protein